MTSAERRAASWPTRIVVVGVLSWSSAYPVFCIVAAAAADSINEFVGRVLAPFDVLILGAMLLISAAARILGGHVGAPADAMSRSFVLEGVLFHGSALLLTGVVLVALGLRRHFRDAQP